jgi:hypothetical protein
MRTLKAHVQNGRLVLDEPTDLPGGTVVEFVRLDDVLAAEADALSDEEQAALKRELEASFDEEAAGQLVDAADVIADLRTRR